MGAVYNPESDIITQIERMEQQSREIRRRVEHVKTAADKRVLNKQLKEIEDQIQFLRQRLP